MPLKGKILPILSSFLFLFDENMIEYWYPQKKKKKKKKIRGQKYIKLVDIATLNQLKHFDETTKRAHGFKHQHCESELKKAIS